MKVLTQSSIKVFTSCPKKYWWKFEQNLMPLETEESDALQWGTALHRGLAAYYTANLSLDAAIEACKGCYKEEFVVAMLTGYDNRYREEDSSLKVVEVESKFSQTIRNLKRNKTHWVARGILDGLVELDGELYLLEHKTASDIDVAYIEKIWADFQTMFYATYYSQQIGRGIVGVIYNVIRKSQKRQGKNETLEQFRDRLVETYLTEDMYHRETVVFDPGLKQKCLDETAYYLSAIQHCRYYGNWYKNYGACSHYGTQCQYFKLCAAPDPTIIAENYYKRVDNPHREMEEPDASSTAY